MVKWGRLFAVFFLAISVILSGCGGGGGDSAPAPPTAPAAPDNVVATAISDNVIRVTWFNVTGATSYNLYYSDNAAFTVDDGLSFDNVTSPYSVTGLNDNTTYHFMVTAVGPGGESEGSIKAQATTFPTSSPGAPPAPTGVSADPGPASATVNWTPVSGATSHNLYYSSNSAFTIATATKISNASPAGQVVTDLIRGTTYYFATTAVNAGGESALSSPKVPAIPDAPNPTFAQSDLTGNWNVQVILTGTTPGWYRFTAVVNSLGVVTISNPSSSSGISIPSIPAWAITTGTGLDNTVGVVTESGAGANTTFHGKMSSSKTLIVGTSTYGAGTYAQHVFLKRTGVTYSNADLANVIFGYNLISTGASNIWEIATGSTNASNQVTLTSWEDSNGTITLPGPNFTTISIDNTSGVVTIGNEPDFFGMMSADKKVIVGTSTDGADVFSLRIIQLRGQTYTAADLAGEYLTHSFHNEPSSSWAWGTWTISDTDSTTASVTARNILNSDGSFEPGPLPPWTYNIDSQGNISVPGNDSSHALMTFGKDMVVDTSDYTGGGSSMSIVIQ